MNKIILLLAMLLIGQFCFAQEPDSEGKFELFDQMSNLPDTSTTFQFPNLSIVSLDKAIDPAEYILGPGDEIAVSIIGPYSKFFSLPISPDGKFVLPEFKVFQVGKNETMAQFKDRMLNYLNKSFRDSDFDIFLSRLKAFRVSISGEIRHPGFYTVNGASKLSDIVKQAGFLETSSARLIKISNGDKTNSYDLLSALYIGDGKTNPYLHQGDKIFVPANEENFNKIEVLGAVNKPGKFEYRPGDTIQRAIDLSLGLVTNADSSHLKIVRFLADSGSYKEINVSLLDNPDFTLKADDRVMAYEISGFREKHAIEIVGEISYPGFYPIKSGVTKLSQVIEAAGGFTGESSLFQAQLFRELKDERGENYIDPELERLNKMLAQDMTEIEREYWKIRTRETVDLVAVDFQKLFEEDRSTFDIPLRDGDRIIIPKLTRNVTVSGAVIYPGITAFKPGLNYQDYIQAAGGFSEKARKSKIQIIRPRTGSWYDADKNFAILEGDIIFIPEKPIRNYWLIARETLTVVYQIAATVAIVINVSK